MDRLTDHAFLPMKPTRKDKVAMSHRIVPIEPTEAMWRAWRLAGGARPLEWAAILAAAPPYVVTDADVERAIDALMHIDAPATSKAAVRAALEAFIKGLQS